MAIAETKNDMDFIQQNQSLFIDSVVPQKPSPNTKNFPSRYTPQYSAPASFNTGVTQSTPATISAAPSSTQPPSSSFPTPSNQPKPPNPSFSAAETRYSSTPLFQSTPNRPSFYRSGYLSPSVSDAPSSEYSFPSPPSSTQTSPIPTAEPSDEYEAYMQNMSKKQVTMHLILVHRIGRVYLMD